MREHPVRAILRRIFSAVVALYFRRVTMLGAAPSRTTRGRLLASNHVNGLVDPILILTRTPSVISPVAKNTLWKIPGLRFLLDVAAAVPIVRRADVPDKAEGSSGAVFARVAEHLSAGGNILIFPEGTSHNEPHLVPLRSGAGRMLAHALHTGATGLTLQAVALSFDARDTFRSRALVTFGPVRDVTAAPDETEDAIADRLTDLLHRDLAALVIEAPTWSTRVAIARVAELYSHNWILDGDSHADSLDIKQQLELRIQTAERVVQTADPAGLAELEQSIANYYDRLAAAGLDDEVVALGVIRRDTGRLLRGLGMLVTAPLALAALPLYYLPYLIPRLVTRRIDHTPDATSTYKLGVALLVFPIWYAVVVIVGALLLPGKLALLLAALMVIAPLAALPWIDRTERLGVVARALFPGAGKHALPTLQAQRRALIQALEAVRVVAEGPDM